MSNYRRLFPNLEGKNCYISSLLYDINYEAILHDGVSLNGMEPPKATLKNKKGKVSDLLYAFGGKMIVSERLKSFLQQVNDSKYFEFIPVDFQQEKMKAFYVLNILGQVDAFDWQKSSYELFDEPGPKGNRVIRSLTRMEINDAETKGRKLFNLLSFEGSNIIHVNLVDQMVKAGFTGMLIDPLIGHKL